MYAIIIIIIITTFFCFYCRNNAKVLLTLFNLKLNRATHHKIFHQDINGFFYVRCCSEHCMDKQKVGNLQIPFLFLLKPIL